MRLPLFVVCAVLAGTQGAAPPRAPATPFVPIGVWYGGGTVRAPMAAFISAASRRARRHASLYIGSFPAAAFEQDPVRNRAAGTLLQAMISDAGVAPDIEITGGDGLVEARVLDSGEARIVIAINHDETARRVTLTFGASLGAGRWTRLETRAASDVLDGVLSWDAGPRDVLVLVRR